MKATTTAFDDHVAALQVENARLVALDSEGFELIHGVLSEPECDELTQRMPDASSGNAGTRSLLGLPWCRSLAELLRDDLRIRLRLQQSTVAVQCTFFDKSHRQNWLVAFHQDLSIPVEERIDSPACAAWSQKEGMIFVQPSAEVLERLVAVRVHLDSSTAHNGPLRVIPGSHVKGRLSAEQVQQWRASGNEVACIAPKGSALLMRPLLLHASSKASSSAPRRVLHFLFGPPDLPLGLRWPRHVMR